jgi:hypothetical protein
MARSRFGDPAGEQIDGLSRHANAGHHCRQMENHHIVESEHADEKV